MSRTSLRHALLLLLPLSPMLSCVASDLDALHAEPGGPAFAGSDGAPSFGTGQPSPERAGLGSLMGIIAADRRQFEPRGAGVVGAIIPGVLDAELTPAGLRAIRLSDPDDRVRLRTATLQGEAVPTAAARMGACTVTSEQVGQRCAPAAEVPRGALTEWWTSSPRGVRQGWTIAAAAADGDTLHVGVALDEGTVESVDRDGRGATLRGTKGGSWRYDELRAWDADGEPLSARLVVEDAGLGLEIDVAGASWPVTVDPLLGPAVMDQTRLTASDGAADAGMGISVSSAGDVDGDGFDDVIVGAWGADHGTSGSAIGAAYLYFGSAAGVRTDTEQQLTASTLKNDAWFGVSVAGAGDLDGDGYDDVIVGAYGDGARTESGDASSTYEGAVYVYYGSASGAGSEQRVSPDDLVDGAAFGIWVDGGYDIDGDGYDDVIVGAYLDEVGGEAMGSARVFYGAASGLDTSSEQKLSPTDGANDDRFGRRVAMLGDVNGDGYGDVGVGAPFDDDDGSQSGSAYIYFGTSTGIDTSTETKLTAFDGAANDYYGSWVAGGGDLDGDGYDDIAVASSLDDHGGSNTGSVYVYFGSADGVRTDFERKVFASDAAAEDRFGSSVALDGDLDGDGLDDLVVGANKDDDEGDLSGSIYVYRGDPGGLDLESETKHTPLEGGANGGFGGSVAYAGDLDGDGLPELIVGADGDDQDGTGAGAAYVLPTLTDQLVAGDDSGEGLRFGADVDSAGDVNGDGYDDIIVGANLVDDWTGAAYVYLGSARGIDAGSEVKLTASDRAPDHNYGHMVGRAGDLNGDGYDDVWVARERDSDGRGALYVYYGSSAGIDPSSEQILMGLDTRSGDGFGSTATAAGDLDGDGYDDLAVAAYVYSAYTLYDGEVYTYLGSASGLDESTEQKLTSSDIAEVDCFGYSLESLGDIDGDGYDDLAVGATNDDDKGSASGSVYVYRGSSTGLDATTEQKLTASDGRANALFGYALGHGDFDADGFIDLAVGAPVDKEAGSNRGKVYLYFGSATGFDASSEVGFRTSDTDDVLYFGIDVAGVGDADGDGYDDLIVGSLSEAAFLYPGSSSGIDTASEQRFSGSGSSSGDFGRNLARAGDIDDDGFSDLLVGEPGYTYSRDSIGSVFVFSGGCRVDEDGDGFCDYEDCDDTDASTFPDAPEIDGDGVDSDCDGVELCLVDADDDGYTLDRVTLRTSDDGDCDDAGEGTLSDETGDCDDDDADVHPDATEGVGDGQDSDCDGGELCYADADDDGYTDGATTVTSSDPDCTDAGEGRDSDPIGDCDDSDATVNPGATEAAGDEVDQDCDGTELCYVDADEDGYTDGATTVVSTDIRCTDDGEGLATDPTGECDDSDATIHPGATESVGDEVDQDCDGAEVCYADADDDGFIDGSTTVLSADDDCSDRGEGLATAPTGECDDSDATIHPGATEGVGDEVDSDCDGAELCFVDADDDGYTDGVSTVSSSDVDCSGAGEGQATDPTGECNDSDASIHPGATEGVADGVDQDCDGGELCYADADGDGYTDGVSTVASLDEDCTGIGEALATAPTGDCDDTDADAHPGGTESVGDGVDGDCDGVELCFVDADDDGVTVADATMESTDDVDCSDPGEGLARDPTGDCDDGDPRVHPGATETCDDADLDEDCDGLADDADDSVAPSSLSYFYDDADGDGYGDALTAQAACDAPTGTVDDGRDCDDSDATIHPGADDVADDGIDQDCDGVDGEGSTGGDGGDGGGAGDDGEDGSGDDGGKSCTTAPASPGFTALLALGLVGLTRRRRAAPSDA